MARHASVSASVRLLVMAALAGSLAVLLPVPVFATHSLPNTPTYWDVGNDSVPDPDVTFNLASSGSLLPWTSQKQSRLSEALSEWNNYTHYNPYLNVTVKGAGCADNYSCHGIYLDTGPCGAGAGQWAPGQLAVTCWRSTLRTDIDNYKWRDIYDADIFLWTTGTGQNGSQPVIWSWSSTGTLPMPSGVYDARGVYTHELGHTVFLKDLYGAACNHGTNVYTLCGELSEDESMYIRNLSPDDINAANSVY